MSDILFIIGGASAQASEAAITSRLEGQGHTVTQIQNSVSVTADATGRDLVLISAEGSSTAVGAKFKDVAVPVINWQVGVADDMGLSTGFTSAGNLGPVTIAPDLPMSAGYNGVTTMYVPVEPLHYLTTIGSGAVVTGTHSTGDPMLISYETGAQMVGLVAPARRVHFPANDDIGTAGTVAALAIFDAAVTWAINESVDSGAGVLGSVIGSVVADVVGSVVN